MEPFQKLLMIQRTCSNVALTKGVVIRGPGTLGTLIVKKQLEKESNYTVVGPTQISQVCLL